MTWEGFGGKLGIIMRKEIVLRRDEIARHTIAGTNVYEIRASLRKEHKVPPTLSSRIDETKVFLSRLRRRVNLWPLNLIHGGTLKLH